MFAAQSMNRFLSLITSKCQIRTNGIVTRKQQKSAGDDESSLGLKHMGRVIQSPKQRVPVPPQNRPQSNKNFLEKKEQTTVQDQGENRILFCAANVFCAACRTKHHPLMK